MSAIYLRLKEARERRGYTVRELSRLTHISERSINYYEKHDHQPQLKQVERLAKILGVDPAWLVSWKD